MVHFRSLLAGGALLLFLSHAHAEAIRPRQTLKHEGSIDVIAFSPDGKTLAAGCRDSRIYLWKLGAEPTARHAEIPRGRFVTLAFAPDGQSLASTSTDAIVRVWAVASGEEVRKIDRPPGPVFTYAVFAPDGKTLATAELGGGLRLWEAAGADVRRVKLVEGRSRGLAYAPDGKSLAVGIGYGQPQTDPALKRGLPLLDPATGEVQRVLTGQAGSVVFSPDGRSIAGWPDDQLIRLWELASGQERWRIPGKFVSVAFAPDGRTIAAADKDAGIVRLWDLASQREIARLDGHDSDIASLAFSPDGKTLASGSGDFTVCLWDMPAVLRRSPPRVPVLARADLDAHWEALGGDDVPKSFVALGTLAAGQGEVAAFLQEQLTKPLVEPKLLAQLIADLDADKFETREAADARLEKLGNLAEPALKQALDARPSLEKQTRLDRLLEKLGKVTYGPAQLRLVRAVEVLERRGGPEARQALEEVARTQLATLAGQEAQAALRRLPVTRPRSE